MPDRQGPPSRRDAEAAAHAGSSPDQTSRGAVEGWAGDPPSPAITPIASEVVGMSAVLASRRNRLFVTSLAALCMAALSLIMTAGAQANGTVDVTVAGTGSGRVTSTSEYFFFGFPIPGANPAPGEIDCSKSGGPICSATFAGSGSPAVRVHLTATPDPGQPPFAGWIQSGASSVHQGCANPAGSPATCSVDVNGTPGPTSEVIAIFGGPPPPPEVATGATDSGANFALVSLEGTVNPGGNAVTSCYFEYGRTVEYGNVTPCDQDKATIGAGNDPVSVTASTEPLESGTTYHFRLVASSEVAEGIGGEAAGEDSVFTTGSFPTGTCPNSDRRAEQGVGTLLLPDCMAIELVSPRKKESQSARLTFTDPFGQTRRGRISADGVRINYVSQAAIGETPALLNAFGDLYVASREPGNEGWSTSSTSPPGPLIKSSMPASFAPDLSSWVQWAVESDDEISLGKIQMFRGGIDRLLVPLSGLTTTIGGDIDGPRRNVDRTNIMGTTLDQSRVYFTPGPISHTSNATALIGGDPAPNGPESQKNTYIAGADEFGKPSLALLARDFKGKAWGEDCGTSVGGPIPVGNPFGQNLGAISPDGSLVFFSTRPDQPAGGSCDPANKLRILTRVDTAAGPWISELVSSECGRVAEPGPLEVPPCGETPGGSTVPDGDDFFQGASEDGTRVYLLTGRQLADSDIDGGSAQCTGGSSSTGCDLYLFDSTKDLGERLTQVSSGDESDASPGAGADVTEVVAISRNGTYAYFKSKDVLTVTPGPSGQPAQAGVDNLYAWNADTGALSFVAPFETGHTLSSPYPVPVVGESAGGIRVGGDGHILVFATNAPLTQDDQDGGFRDIFRYDAESAELIRVSKSLDGDADNGPHDVNAGGRLGQGILGDDSDLAELSRWVSDDGNTIAFTTSEGLLPGDRNGVVDSYLWRHGNLYRLPGTADFSGTLKDSPLVSQDGSTVAFQSYEQLSPVDGDSASDIYAARVEGGLPIPKPPTTCRPDGAEGCQGAAPRPPERKALASRESHAVSPVEVIKKDRSKCRVLTRQARRFVRRAKRLRHASHRTTRTRRARLRRRSARYTRKAKHRRNAARRCRSGSAGKRQNSARTPSRARSQRSRNTNRPGTGR